MPWVPSGCPAPSTRNRAHSLHGRAHGAELPAGSNALLHSLTFVIATGLLHLPGILLGETRRWPGGRRFMQGPVASWR